MHPPSNRMPYERNGRATQSRRSRGARRAFLIVASFRTWRGSEAFVARDPNINAAQQFRIIWITALRREFSLARADCEYRAPLAPRLAWPQTPVSARHAIRSMPTQLRDGHRTPESGVFLQSRARPVIKTATLSLSHRHIWSRRQPQRQPTHGQTCRSNTARFTDPVARLRFLEPLRPGTSDPDWP